MILQTKRELKNIENKNKILNAVDELLNKHDISYLTIKNVCLLAQISNGTFFNLYKSKDDLLIDYMYHKYNEYKKFVPINYKADDIFYNIVEMHVHNIIFSKSLGVDFTRVYYNISNPYLNNRNNIEGEDYTIELYNMIKEAYDKNEFNTDETAEEIYANVCMIVKGVILEWAICGDSFDVEYYIRKMLNIYLDTLRK